jgi:hypothetical protein
MTGCGETIDGVVCGKPVTDEVSWPDRERPEYPPATPTSHGGQIICLPTYPHKAVRRVCGDCAGQLMAWAATHLHPTGTTRTTSNRCHQRGTNAFLPRNP